MTQPSDPPAALPASDHLSVTGLSDSLALLGAAYAISTEKSVTIQAQPAVSLSLIQTLPEDLALLKQHVDAFQHGESLGGALLGSFEALRTIAQSVRDLASGLLPTARRLDSGSTETDLTAFRDALEALKVRTTALDPDAHSAALPLVQARAALTAFASDQLADDVTRFQAAAEAVHQAEVIAELEQQISGLQSKIDGLNAQVAEGATSQILQSITFGFEIAESAMKAETDAGSAVLGVGFAIKGEVEEGMKFAEEMKRRNEEINSLIEQYRGMLETLAADRQEMALLLTVGGHAKAFGTSVYGAADVLTRMLGEIQALAGGIDSLVLIDEAPAGFFTSQLNSAVAAWEAVSGGCDQQLQLARSLT